MPTLRSSSSSTIPHRRFSCPSSKSEDAREFPRSRDYVVCNEKKRRTYLLDR